MDSNVLEKIRMKIGEPVIFTYPNGQKLHGTLIDRVLMYTRSITQMKDFIDVVDLIEFEVGGLKKEAVRFGYYIYEDGNLRWGSQTTLTEDRSELLKLFRLAAEKNWFRELLESALL